MKFNEPFVQVDKHLSHFSVSKTVNTKRYHDAFALLPLPSTVCESAYRQAGRILRKANGTELEYLAVIDARTGDLVVDNLYRRASPHRAALSLEEKSLATACPHHVVTIHNHPSSKEPSYQDIVTAARNDKILGSLVVAHDASVWYLSIPNASIAGILEREYNAIRSYTGEYAKALAVRHLLEANEQHHLFTLRRFL